MKELISVHVGQAGIQIGSACWQLFAQQHSITHQGKLQESASPEHSSNMLFYQTPHGKYVPRTVLVDLDPTPVDQIRTGKHCSLFKPSQLISGKQDAASNYSRGHYTIGKEYIDQVGDVIRKLANQCDNLEGFMLCAAVGGGTGSGLGDLIEESIGINFGTKKSRIGARLFSSAGLGYNVVEPINTLMNFRRLKEQEDMTLAFDNQSLYNICTSKLGIENPSYADLNRVVARAVSETTRSMRFGGCLNTDIKELRTNLVPYPRINFIAPSYSPFFETDKSKIDNIPVSDLTAEVFETSNQMVSIKPDSGKYMSCALMYGGDVTPKEAFDSIVSLRTKRTVNFVDWCPTGFKVSINEPYPHRDANTPNKSCFLLSNSSSFKDTFRTLTNKFDIMYERRAFIHWYFGEGIESGEFGESRQSLEVSIRDYQQLERVTVVDDDESEC